MEPAFRFRIDPTEARTMAKSSSDLDDLKSDANDLAVEARDVALNVIQEQPITSILIAVLFGIVIGKLVL
jgi:ElaB/YqjD/DUF883 family membrane-anchored ribosome-binding protein